MAEPVASSPSTLRFSWPIVAAYAAVVIWFLAALAQFYVPGKGFTALIEFGSDFAPDCLPVLKTLPHYVEPYSAGYDGQFYAQLALDPLLRNPGQLSQAMDGPSYRARRILAEWAAYGLGLGRPVWVLEAYAVLNVLVWLALAWVLLRWFPPVSPGNFLRWAGILLSLGLCQSVRSALTDGPSLLLTVVALGLVERGRWNKGVAAFALGGLCKETSLLSAAALWRPEERSGRAWGRLAFRGLMVVAPLAVWVIYIRFQFGALDAAGARNFSLPFSGMAQKWMDIWREWRSDAGWSEPLGWSVAGMIGLTVQWLFLILRPRWREVWWRGGIGFAGLLVILGPAVWEGYPGAVIRVLLPLQAAFNVLVPRGRRWLPVLVLGNLSVLAAPGLLRAPLKLDYVVAGTTVATQLPDGAPRVVLTFPTPWHGAEDAGWGRFRRWSGGTAKLEVVNQGARFLTADLSFKVSGITPRQLVISRGGETLWSGEIGHWQRPVRIRLGLPPKGAGSEPLVFKTDLPPERPGGGDPRLLAFCVYDLRVELTVREKGAAPP